MPTILRDFGFGIGTEQVGGNQELSLGKRRVRDRILVGVNGQPVGQVEVFEPRLLSQDGFTG